MVNDFFSNYLFFLLKVRKARTLYLMKPSLLTFIVIMLFSAFTVNAQTTTITGTIMAGDDNGGPLPGVTIIEKVRPMVPQQILMEITVLL